MSAFVSSVTVICISLLVAAIVKLMAPQGNCEKILKRIISMFVLISVAICASSVVKALNSEKMKTYDSKISDNVADIEVLETTADYVADYIVGLLESEGIVETTAEVKIQADENSVINISEVCIYISKEQISSSHKIIEIIKENFLLTPDVIVKEQ